jgi:predicted neutral ceramidase superfamily lipid hydrolase
MLLVLSELRAVLAPLAKMLPQLVLATAAVLGVMFLTFMAGVDAGLFLNML